MSAIVPANGQPRQLDRRPEPDEQITEDQVKDPASLVRLLMSLLRDVATAKRRWWPRRIDFEDRAVDGTGTTVYSFPHGFGTRVRWYVVDWSGATAGPRLVRHTSTTDNTLTLVSYTAGTATLRVEVAG